MRLKKLPSYFATSGHTHAIYVLTANHGGTHAIGQGGTGQVTQQTAINALSNVAVA